MFLRIEDWLYQDDWESYTKMTEAFSSTQIVGDDLLVTLVSIYLSIDLRTDVHQPELMRHAPCYPHQTSCLHPLPALPPTIYLFIDRSINLSISICIQVCM